MIYQFSNTLAAPQYHIRKRLGSACLLEKEGKRVKKSNANTRIKPQIDSHEYRLVWRDVTNAVDRRTLIATILPPNVFLGNTLSYIRPKTFDGNDYVASLSNQELFYLCGMLNSFPVDFILRHRVNLHVSMFHLLELPIPKFDASNKWHSLICSHATKLICTSDEFVGMMHDVGIGVGVKDVEERTRLQALINVASCKIYGIDKEELQFILEYFSIEDERLKQATLSEFDMLD